MQSTADHTLSHKYTLPSLIYPKIHWFSLEKKSHESPSMRLKLWNFLKVPTVQLDVDPLDLETYELKRQLKCPSCIQQTMVEGE